MSVHGVVLIAALRDLFADGVDVGGGGVAYFSRFGLGFDRDRLPVPAVISPVLVWVVDGGGAVAVAQTAMARAVFASVVLSRHRLTTNGWLKYTFVRRTVDPQIVVEEIFW